MYNAGKLRVIWFVSCWVNCWAIAGALLRSCEGRVLQAICCNLLGSIGSLLCEILNVYRWSDDNVLHVRRPV